MFIPNHRWFIRESKKDRAEIGSHRASDLNFNWNENKFVSGWHLFKTGAAIISVKLRTTSQTTLALDILKLSIRITQEAPLSAEQNSNVSITVNMDMLLDLLRMRRMLYVMLLILVESNEVVLVQFSRWRYAISCSSSSLLAYRLDFYGFA